MSKPTIDFDSVAMGSSDAGPDLIKVFDAAINGNESAEATAAKIDEMFPKDQGAKVMEDFTWTLWTLFLSIAQKVPAEDERQQLLVDVVATLKAKDHGTITMWDQECALWGDLPMLGPCMREAWNGTPAYDGSEKDATSISEWVSINSMAARLHGASIQTWENFAIWSLRPSLEEKEATKPSEMDTLLRTSCEWVENAGKALVEQGRQERALDSMEERALRPGKLFESTKSGLSPERWTFWRERLAELGPGASTDELKERTQKAVSLMKELEG